MKSHNKDKEKCAFVNESQSPNNQQRKHNRNTYEKGSQITRSTHTDGVTQSHSTTTQTYKTRENSKIDRNENSKNKVPSKSHPSSKTSNWLNRLPLIENTYLAKCEIEISQPTKRNQHDRINNDRKEQYRQKNKRTLVGQYPFITSAPHLNDQMKNILRIIVPSRKQSIHAVFLGSTSTLSGQMWKLPLYNATHTMTPEVNSIPVRICNRCGDINTALGKNTTKCSNEQNLIKIHVHKLRSNFKSISWQQAT